MMITHFTCPCCGYAGLDVNPYRDLPPAPWKEESHGAPPYCQKYGEASYDVCDCCGFEFGNDDEPGTASPATFRDFRTEWIADGCRWFDEKKKPSSWVLSDQLSFAGIALKEAANQSSEPTSLTRRG